MIKTLNKRREPIKKRFMIISNIPLGKEVHRIFDGSRINRHFYYGKNENGEYRYLVDIGNDRELYNIKEYCPDNIAIIQY